MSKQKAEKQIPTSKRPAVSVSAMSGSVVVDPPEPEGLPDLTVSEPEPDLASSIVETVTDSADDGDVSAVVAEPEEAVFFVYEPKCLQCSHLVAFAETQHNGCHFTSGNEDCPAQSVTISIKLPMTKIVRNFLRAEEDGDTEKLGRLYATLSEKPDWARRQILEALQEARERASAR